MSNAFNSVGAVLDDLSTNLGEIGGQAGRSMLSSFMSLISTISKIASSLIVGFNGFVKYNFIRLLADRGNGVVLFRFIFGYFMLECV
ncbi:hypothetical protein [Malacoplasma muris]|uniref:hypothetical protein n=1 Tax=Malacoplasma muris TaxID=2119 RepID=UPI00398E943C